MYKDPFFDDEYRVLVDRLWPKGVKRYEFRYDYWTKETAPSSTLRTWYHEDIEGRRDAFVVKYKEELDTSVFINEFIRKVSEYDMVTLLYAAKNTINRKLVFSVEFVGLLFNNLLVKLYEFILIVCSEK